jgi:translation initiation factor 5A
MSNENYDIDVADSGASKTVSTEAGQIRKGGYIMIKGKPCKVKDVSVSKTGKHGHAKCKFSASDIFTGASCEELCPSTHSIDVPIVIKKIGWYREYKMKHMFY